MQLPEGIAWAAQGPEHLALLEVEAHSGHQQQTLNPKLNYLRASPGLLKDPKIWPCWELRPTAVTSRRPEPSSTLLPDCRKGAPPVSFTTSSDSPVKALSSTLNAGEYVSGILVVNLTACTVFSDKTPRD